MSIEKNNKRIRAANFSDVEEKLLLQCVLKRKKIIEDKRTDAHTTDAKNTAWNEITHEFNASSANLEPRTIKALRDKYTNVKCNLRKKFASKEINRITTDDGQSDLEVESADEVCIAEVEEPDEKKNVPKNDWSNSNYTPKMLQTELSAPLKISKNPSRNFTHSDLKTRILEQEIELNELKKAHLRKNIGLLDSAKQMQDELMAMSRAEHKFRMQKWKKSI